MRKMFRAVALSLVTAMLFALPIALAESLVIYPMESDDILLGVAVADQLELAFQDEFEVYGPALASGLVPPYVVQNGFINPISWVSQIEGGATGSRTGAAFLQDALGTDYVLTGSIENSGDDEVVISFFVASDEGVRDIQVVGPAEDPTRLVKNAIAVLSGGLAFGVERPDVTVDVDLSTSYGDYVRALALLGAGLMREATTVLESSLEEAEDVRTRALLSEIEAATSGEDVEDNVLAGIIALNSSPVREPLVIAYFEAAKDEVDFPALQVWLAALSASANDRESAASAFETLDESYLYGRAARAAFRTANDIDGGLADIRAVQNSNDIAALIAADSAAESLEDNELRKAILSRLSAVARDLPYSYQELSFIAFDEDDALAAAQALTVGVEVDPESSLFWTNLGWSQYLLGDLEASEASSIRATELQDEGNQFGQPYIAWYNLGLVRVVTGRLDSAMNAYNRALRLDPDVDDEAIIDLENALELYPEQTGVHYSLAVLYETEGRFDEAAVQYEAYVARVDEDGSFVQEASERANALKAPPPAIEIAEVIDLNLGTRFFAETPYHPGDRIVPNFEVFTPDSELPREMTLTLSLLNASGDVIASRSGDIDLPADAIGYFIDTAGLTLPVGLESDTYTFRINITASRDRSVSTDIPVEISGVPLFSRQLLSRDIVMEDIQGNAAYYGSGDLDRPDSIIVERLIDALRTTADIAEDVLPLVTEGRFEGFGGRKLFNDSSEQDVQDFLTWLLASETADANFAFVDAYAQWALEGAPLAQE